MSVDSNNENIFLRTGTKYNCDTFSAKKTGDNSKELTYLSWNSDTTYTNHPSLFYDMTHLNEIGAIAFTKDFIGKLKKKGFLQ